MRSTRNKALYATGPSLVAVTLWVCPPWDGMLIGVPVGVRLHPKGAETTTDLATEIIYELAQWRPDRSFSLCADGAYAALAGRGLPRSAVTSRMRRDAALYKAPPPRTGERERPPMRRARLGTPQATADGLTNDAFSAVDVEWRGRTKDLLVSSAPLLCYSVNVVPLVPLVLLVVVGYPEAITHDDFFSTDLDAAPGDVASRYAGRRSNA